MASASRERRDWKLLFFKSRRPTTLHIRWESSRDAKASENALIRIAAGDGETQLETEIIHDMDSENESGYFVEHLESDETYIKQIGIVS